MKRTISKVAAAALIAAITGTAGTAQAQTLSFISSVGSQPSNVGTVTISQVNGTTVNVLVDLLDGYGFINTGGPHTPFAFNLAGSETGVGATFLLPPAGTYSFGLFSLSTADGGNTPYGEYGISINSSAGNGSSNAYMGDLSFDVTRGSGLLTTDFVANTNGYYFSADLTDGRNTGAQAWDTAVTVQATPEPGTYMLLATGLAGLAAARRRRRTA